MEIEAHFRLLTYVRISFAKNRCTMKVHLGKRIVRINKYYPTEIQISS